IRRSMQTVKDLGALVKTQYPQYVQFDDEVVGRLVKKKYPHAYREFIDVFDAQFDHVVDRYSSKHGRIKAWFKGKQAENRAEHLGHLVQEREHLLKMYEQDLRPEEIQRNHEVVLLQAELIRSQVEYDRTMLEEAIKVSLDLETYKKVRLEQEMSRL